MSAQLSHDTELFSNMVNFLLFRIPTVSSCWELSNNALRLVKKLAKSQSGMRVFDSHLQITTFE
jgi:hypothetical protein